jgi:hypothetical protein
MRFLAFTIVSKLHLFQLSSILLRRYNDSLAISTLLLLSDLTTRKDLAVTLQKAARVLGLRLRQQLRTLMSRKAFKKLQAELLCSVPKLCAYYQDYQKLSLMSLLLQQSNCSILH